MTRGLKLGVTAAVLGLAALAQAYILPGTSILRRMTEGRDDLQLAALKVDGSLSFYGAAAGNAGAALSIASDGAELQTESSIFLRLPGRCRLEAFSSDGSKRSAFVEAGGKRRVEGPDIAGLGLALAQVCPLLASRSAVENEARGTVERHLAKLKIDFHKSSLSRLGGQVTYVLGEPGEASPQLWIYKDNFLPARLRFSDEAGTGWDVRFLDYASPATGEWFPRIIEVAKGGERYLKFTGQTADAKPKLEDKLF